MVVGAAAGRRGLLSSCQVYLVFYHPAFSLLRLAVAQGDNGVMSLLRARRSLRLYMTSRLAARAGRGGGGLSRRRFMQAAIGSVGVSSVATSATARAASGTSSHRTFTDAVLRAFSSHRLVGLGEAHNLQEHHDAVQALLLDPQVADVVDDIVVEFGNALYQDTIDSFIAGNPIANVDLRPVWRNTTQSPLSTWDEPVYEQFFQDRPCRELAAAPTQEDAGAPRRPADGLVEDHQL